MDTTTRFFFKTNYQKLARNPFLDENSELWAIIVFILSILSCLLNALVVILFFYDAKLRKHLPNVLAASLALADLLLAVTYLVLEHAHIIRPAPQSIEWTLTINPVIFVCLISSQLASVFHVMLLTIDRFIAIIHPLKYLRWVTEMRKRMLKVSSACLIVWIFSATFSSIWAWNVIAIGYPDNPTNTTCCQNETKEDIFSEMGQINNAWTLTHNFILLFLLCSTMALYIPILKAIFKTKRTSRETHKRAASFKVFSSLAESSSQPNCTATNENEGTNKGRKKFRPKRKRLLKSDTSSPFTISSGMRTIYEGKDLSDKVRNIVRKVSVVSASDDDDNYNEAGSTKTWTTTNPNLLGIPQVPQNPLPSELLYAPRENLNNLRPLDVGSLTRPAGLTKPAFMVRSSSSIDFFASDNQMDRKISHQMKGSISRHESFLEARMKRLSVQTTSTDSPSVWRKLNSIRVESCASISRQLSRSNLNLNSIKPLFHFQLQGATTIFIIVACLWVGYLPDCLLSIIYCFRYLDKDFYNVAYSVCAVLKVVNAVTNPVIYCLRTEAYRTAFLRLYDDVRRILRKIVGKT